MVHAGSDLFVFSDGPLCGQFLQQRLSLLEVERIEPFGASASSISAARHSHQHASGDSQRAVVKPADEIVGRRHRPIAVG